MNFWVQTCSQKPSTPHPKSIMGVVLMLLVILGTIGHSATSIAGTTVALRESYAGNLSFELTGGSFRTQHNNSNSCSVTGSNDQLLNTLPLDATIVKAYLYWAGSGTADDRDVIFNGDSIDADRWYTENWDGTRTFYNGVADVTYIVQRDGNTRYTVSGLTIDTSSTYCNNQTVLGGWALMVIYESDAEDFRVLNLYEGFQSYQHSQVTLIPNNFKLPANPTGKHAHISWEGDDTLGTDGEYLEFEGVGLSDSVNPSDNQFNSYSNVQGGFTSYGVDIDEYDISPYLTEGATSVNTVYSAGQDLVLLSAEVISVSNIPVADLAVTTSDPTGWTQDFTVTKKYTVSNNGPNDIPANSVRFTTTLPAGVSFTGTQGNSDWVCSVTNANQTISCIFNDKLRSGWSDYLDLTLKVDDGTAGNSLIIDVAVDHDTAPYDIFDNQESNNNYQFTVPVLAMPVIDLSASSKVYTNLSGDLLLAGDTLRYTITLDDASDLSAPNITVTDDLPANISNYQVISSPVTAVFSAGGSNGTGTLTFSGITLTAGTPGSIEQIVIEVDIDPSAPDGASLQNQATLAQGSDAWLVDTGEITVVEPDLSTSTKDAEDVNGGWLLPNETARYTITLDNPKDLDLTSLQITDHLPANVSSFTVSNLPSGAQDFSVNNGGNNSTGYIDIRNISLDAASTLDIYVDVTVDSDAPDKADFTNTATITLNNTTWVVTSNELKVSLTTSTPASGNKPLYFDDTNLSRNIPTNNVERTFSHGENLTWILENNLQSDLTLSAGDMSLNLAVEGYRTGSATTDFNIELFYNDNVSSGEVAFASGDKNAGNYKQNTSYDVPSTLTLDIEHTIPAGSSIYLRISNTSSNGLTNKNRDLIGIRSYNNSFYSKAVLNASTVINVDSISVWDTTYGDPTGAGDGNALPNSQPDTNLYIRAVISDPFGAFDISSADINIVKTNGDVYDFSAHPDGNTNIMSQVDDTADDLITNTKTFEKEITLEDEGEITGYWAITIKGYEGMEVAPDQVTHESLLSYQIKPFLPNIALTKTVSVTHDPINLYDNPKAIPGALIRYTITAINTGRGASDESSIILQDEIPAGSELYIGTLACPGPETDDGPVCFEDGSGINESGLIYDFIGTLNATDDVWFSVDGTDFTYDPVDAGGYDSAIRFIRITPAGIFNKVPKNGTEQPEFNFSYQIRLN